MSSSATAIPSAEPVSRIRWTDPADTYPRALSSLVQHIIRLDRVRKAAQDELDMEDLDKGCRERALELLGRLYTQSPGLSDKLDRTFITAVYAGELQLEWSAGLATLVLEVRADGRFRSLYHRNGEFVARAFLSLEDTRAHVSSFLQSAPYEL